jgi:hypothetical protein
MRLYFFLGATSQHQGCTQTPCNAGGRPKASLLKFVLTAKNRST